MLDAKRMLDDNGVEAQEIHKGWINVQCPFCDDEGMHGGFNISGSYYTCFRCKYHWVVDAVAQIIGVDRHQAGEILKQYSDYVQDREEEYDVKVDKVKLPIGCGRMNEACREYLRNRGFDDKKLEREWGLMGTGYLGEYKFRVIAPIYLKGELISYQGRDITDRSQERYKACPKSDEVLNLKNTLYGIDKAKGKTCVVVEGIPLVWRLGAGAIATFGIDYTQQQVNIIQSTYDHIFILYDNEINAHRMSCDLANHIDAIKDVPSVEILRITDLSDYDDMTDREAFEFMQPLLQGS